MARLPSSLPPHGPPFVPADALLPGSLESVDADTVDLLPGEVPALSWHGAAPERQTLTLDRSLMTALATRALAAGSAGQTAVGIAAVQHGDGTTTVARGLAACLAEFFGKRVVLVEANQRSPSLRRIYRLVDGPGLADVLGRRASLGGALQMAGEHRTMLVLPASLPQGGKPRGAAVAAPASLRELVIALLGHADAVVLDLAPVLPYRDTAEMCPAMDGVGLVLRGGRSTKRDGALAVQTIRDGGAPVLGAVLNRSRSYLPRYLERFG